MEKIEQEAEKKRQMEEALTLQALASEEERSRRLVEEAEQHAKVFFFLTSFFQSPFLFTPFLRPLTHQMLEEQEKERLEKVLFVPASQVFWRVAHA